MNDSDLGYDLEWEYIPVVVLIVEQEENELEFA
jgi:hypothetical protein